MQKIIAAFDGFKFSQSNLNYAIALAAKANAHLTNVFLDDKTYTRYAIYDLVFEDGVSQKKMSKLVQQDARIRNEAASKVVEVCSQIGVSFNIHHDENVALDELLHETIFADLLIINNKESFTHHEEKYPSRFLQDLLSNTQTPVFLTPDSYKPIEKIVYKEKVVYKDKTIKHDFIKKEEPKISKNKQELLDVLTILKNKKKKTKKDQENIYTIEKVLPNIK